MSFDTLAQFYSAAEWLVAGNVLQKCRLAYVDEARTANEILLVGEGHGRFLQELVRINERGAICCVDSSPRMLDVSKRRIDAMESIQDRVRFVPMPIENFDPGRSFDFLGTQFFLDCFPELELSEVVRKLATLLKPGGRWLLCDFQVPPGGWRRVRASAALWLAYAFFRCATTIKARRIVPPEKMIAANGLRRVRRVEFNFGLIYAELWEKPAMDGNFAPLHA